MTDFTWSNPNPAPGIIRDPFILREGDGWFLTGSSRPFWEGPVDELRLWRSTDLETWEDLGAILRRADIPADAWYRDRLWAPEIHRQPEGFYLTFNGRNDETGHKHSVALAFSASIVGPYEVLTADEPLIVLGETDRYTGDDGQRYLANDGCLFSEDGRHYVAYSSGRGIHGQEIDLKTATRIGDEFTIAEPHADSWDAHIEGPSLVRIGDRIFCFFSSYTRGYEVGITSSPDIRGPWTADTRNPVMGARGFVTAAGHTGWFAGPDDTLWLSYHVESAELDGEQLSIDPVLVDDQGLPILDGPTWGPQRMEGLRTISL